jgi:hypothetical protein
VLAGLQRLFEQTGLGLVIEDRCMGAQIGSAGGGKTALAMVAGNGAAVLGQLGTGDVKQCHALWALLKHGVIIT